MTNTLTLNFNHSCGGKAQYDVFIGDRRIENLCMIKIVHTEITDTGNRYFYSWHFADKSTNLDFAVRKDLPQVNKVNDYDYAKKLATELATDYLFDRDSLPT